MGKKDHCSFVPDGEWGSCCKNHDIDYKNKIISRKEADNRMKDCIKNTGHPFIAQLYYIGVRLFGWIFH
jgi:hypothetical protein